MNFSTVQVVPVGKSLLMSKIQARPTGNTDDDAWFESHLDAMALDEAEQWCAAATRTDSQFDYRAVPVHTLLLDDAQLHVLRAALAAHIEQLEVYCRIPDQPAMWVTDLAAARKMVADSWLI